MYKRRKFIKASMLGALALNGSIRAASAFSLPREKNRKFTMQLDGGAIGVEADQMELIRLAHQYGFESVSAQASYLADLSDDEMEQLKEEMQNKMLVWGNSGLPVQFRTDTDTFVNDMKALPAKAKGLERAGVQRVTTWIMPNHASLHYLQNFRQHSTRLREVAKVLGDHGLRFGLEYVGPKTLQVANRYPFMSTMAETKELIAAIGEPNVGFVLDSFHWYTAHEDVNDILTLENRDIVACDLNDARTGYGPDEQVDGKRELPMASGVIDVKAFLDALIKIGYDGPVRAEPFNQALRDMPDEKAVATTAAAMKAAFASL